MGARCVACFPAVVDAGGVRLLGTLLGVLDVAAAHEGIALDGDDLFIPANGASRTLHLQIVGDTVLDVSPSLAFVIRPVIGRFPARAVAGCFNGTAREHATAGDAPLLASAVRCDARVAAVDFDGDGVDALVGRRGRLLDVDSDPFAGSVRTEHVLPGNDVQLLPLAVLRGPSERLAVVADANVAVFDGVSVESLGVPVDQLVAADLDGDGTDELVESRPGYLWIADQERFLDIASDELAAGDVDGDGRDDIVVISVVAVGQLLLSTRDWVPSPPFPVPSRSGVAVHDDGGIVLVGGDVRAQLLVMRYRLAP